MKQPEPRKVYQSYKVTGAELAGYTICPDCDGAIRWEGPNWRGGLDGRCFCGRVWELKIQEAVIRCGATKRDVWKDIKPFIA